MSSKSYNFIQAEQTHQHAGHVPKSWDEKEECTDEHPFILTMALKQQNTEGMSLFELLYIKNKTKLMHIISVYRPNIFIFIHCVHDTQIRIAFVSHIIYI